MPKTVGYIPGKKGEQKPDVKKDETKKGEQKPDGAA